MHAVLDLKGQFTLKSKIHTGSAVCIQLNCFGDTDFRGVCLLLNIMELDGTQPVVLKAPKNTFETTAEGKTFLHETAHNKVCGLS